MNRHFTEAEITDPQISGPDADPNGDGRSNFYHYAFGTDPRAAGSAADGLPSIAFDGVSMELTYRFRDPALDLQFIVETSEDFASWAEATVELVQSVSDGEITTVTVRVTAPAGAATPSRKFVRVRANP